jgi:hypothetical protein
MTEKRLKAIEISSNKALDVNFYSPVTNTFLYGQKSKLYAESFRKRLGSWISAVYKNILTATGENVSLLHSGADMVGKYIEVELVSDSYDEIVIELTTIGYE